jgi:hypothetical protein
VAPLLSASKPYLIYVLHLYRYIPFLAGIFSIVPLSVNEWLLVIAWSAPVMVLDEVLKALGRSFFGVQKIKID